MEKNKKIGTKTKFRRLVSIFLYFYKYFYKTEIAIW